MSSDSTTGWRSWNHFVQGGTWNTTAQPDPEQINRDIESTVTWWSPGQYVPLGLLTSAGLPLGASMTILAMLSAFSAAIGLIILARLLGAPATSAPWIAWAIIASWHTLYAFGMFIGGEIILAGVWPWIVVAAWSLRDQPVKFVVVLTPLFALGAFAKHSFAIYGLALLVFLWFERLRSRPPSWSSVWRATAPIAMVGLLFLVVRGIWFPLDAATPAEPGRIESGFSETLGFASIGPLLSATGVGSLMGKVFFWMGIKQEDGWRQLGLPLALVSPVVIFGYVRMARSPSAHWRLAGWLAGVSAAVMFLLLIRGGAISLEDRHFRPAGLLILMAIGVECQRASRNRRWIARVAVVAVVLFGLASAAQRVVNLRKFTSETYPFGPAMDVPKATTQFLRSFSENQRNQPTLFCVASQNLSLLLPQDRVLIFSQDNLSSEKLDKLSYAGSAGDLLLVLPKAMDEDGRAALLRERFIDYRKAVWTEKVVEGWHFWHAVSPD